MQVRNLLIAAGAALAATTAIAAAPTAANAQGYHHAYERAYGYHPYAFHRFEPRPYWGYRPRWGRPYHHFYRR